MSQATADLTHLTRDIDPRVRFQASLALLTVNPATIESVSTLISEGMRDSNKQVVIRRTEQAVSILVAVVLKQADWKRRKSAR